MIKSILCTALVFLSVYEVARTQVIVNPDGTHSVIAGNVIVNPNGTHSVVTGNVIVNPNGTHSVVAGNVIVNSNGSHSVIVGNSLKKADGSSLQLPDFDKSFSKKRKSKEQLEKGEPVDWDQWNALIFGKSKKQNVQLNKLKLKPDTLLPRQKLKAQD